MQLPVSATKMQTYAPSMHVCYTVYKYSQKSKFASYRKIYSRFMKGLLWKDIILQLFKNTIKHLKMGGVQSDIFKPTVATINTKHIPWHNLAFKISKYKRQWYVTDFIPIIFKIIQIENNVLYNYAQDTCITLYIIYRFLLMAGFLVCKPNLYLRIPNKFVATTKYNNNNNSIRSIGL
jgi:hypothetical protein